MCEYLGGPFFLPPLSPPLTGPDNRGGFGGGRVQEVHNPVNEIWGGARGAVLISEVIFSVMKVFGIGIILINGSTIMTVNISRLYSKCVILKGELSV